MLAFFLPSLFLFFFFLKPKQKKQKEDGPLPATTFYGLIPPTAALKASIKPSLKDAFSSCSTTPSLNQQIPKTSNPKGKKCTAQFGCSNVARFTEKSGTFYCTIHKPKGVPVTPIQTQESKATRKKAS